MRFSQHYIDILNIKENRLETVSFLDIIEDEINLNLDLFGVKDYESMERMRMLGKKDRDIWILTFDKLLSKTSFAGVMHRMLKKLEEVYNYPVEIEFTVNFTRYNDYRINLLQCRPLQTKGIAKRAEIPKDIPSEMLLFQSDGHFMGGSISKVIKWIIYVNPFRYSVLPLSDKYTIARLIGKLNRLIKNRDEIPALLLGPGRWGTTTPSLGVPVRFSEINNFTAIGEIGYLDGNLLPELSYGTHFFQDLVETDIFYLALFPDTPGFFFNIELLERFGDISGGLIEDGNRYHDVLKVYDVSPVDMRLMADIISRRLVCFIEKEKAHSLIECLKFRVFKKC